MMKSHRVDWIDAAKGLGIWLVAVGHLLSAEGASGTAERIIWSFHMPLFFYLSGLTAKVAHGASFKDDLRKCVQSIVVPYLVFSILSIALYSVRKSPDLPTLGGWLLEMIYGVSGRERWMSYNVPLWFFTCLFSVRVLFLGFSAWLEKPWRVLSAALVCAVFAHGFFMLSIPRLPWNVDVAMCALVFYSAGHAWTNRRLIGESMPWVWRLAAVVGFSAMVGVVVVTNGRVDMNGRNFGNPVLFYVGAFSGIIASVLVAQSLSRFRWLISAGIASVVVFPMHGLLDYFIPARALSIVNWYINRATGSVTASALVFGAIEVALCMPFYWLFASYAPVLIGRKRTNDGSTVKRPEAA